MKKAIFWVFVVLLALPNAGLAENNNPPTNCDIDSYIAPVVEIEQINDHLSMSWNQIDHDNLAGYKVVISKDDSTPVYPANGYLRWITDTNITSYSINNSSAYRSGDFGGYLESGEDYYFSVTAVYDCGGTRTSVAGNVLESVYPGNVQDDEDDTNDDDDDHDTSNIAPATPEVTITSSENGTLLSWKKIDDDRFNGYKVVASKSNTKPKYPTDGYLKYITEDDVTRYLINNSSAYRNGDFGQYFKEGELYYFSVTALYSTGKIAGNAISAAYEGPEHKVVIKPDVDPLIEMERNAEKLRNSNLGDILAELQELRSIIKEQQNELKYLRGLVNDIASLNQEVRDSLNQFITYGVDENTKKLGEGERAAVIHSYKSAFNKLPETDEELTDAIKIANGRWPSKTSEEAEHRAKVEFKKIYLRDADTDHPNDNAAVTVMAYGLRQKAENRNLDSEREGIKTFKYIYGHTPDTTEEWNIMQAVTYSGATR